MNTYHHDAGTNKTSIFLFKNSFSYRQVIKIAAYKQIMVIVQKAKRPPRFTFSIIIIEKFIFQYEYATATNFCIYIQKFGEPLLLGQGVKGHFNFVSALNSQVYALVTNL
jgi:hypothetical protein